MQNKLETGINNVLKATNMLLIKTVAWKKEAEDKLKDYQKALDVEEPKLEGMAGKEYEDQLRIVKDLNLKIRLSEETIDEYEALLIEQGE